MPRALFVGRRALVTGASSGIGRELARGLAERGAELIVVGRSLGRLEELARELRSRGAVVTVLESDLGQPEATSDLVRELGARGLSVDHYVGCAGFGAVGAVAALSGERARELLQVNVVALAELTHALLPAMLERKSGGVLLVASAVGHFPLPFMADYAASKAFVLSFGRALSQELRGSGVSCTVLCPGTVPTGFQATAGFSERAGILPGALSARAVAEQALRAYAGGVREVVPGLATGLGVRLAPLVPMRVFLAAAEWVLRRIGRI